MSLSSNQTATILSFWHNESHRYPACNTPLEALQKISLRSLFRASKTGEKKIFRGCYLLVRTTSEYWDMNALRPSCEVEDEHGTRCIALLKSLTLLDRNWKTYIVIKEPHKLVLNPQPDGMGVFHVSLPVMHRTDWEIISSTSALIPNNWQDKYWQGKTRLELKDAGNGLYKAKKWWAAIERYTQAMAQPSMPSVPNDMLLRNRAIAARCGGLLDAALSDSNEAVCLDPGNSKNLLQLARTYYIRRDFEDAAAQLRCLLALDPRHVDGESLMSQCKKRLHEAKTGEYAFPDMDKEFRVRKLDVYFDVADYAGPVEVKTVEKFGRGLYTTKDVKAGELLLVSKAMSLVYYGSEQHTDVHRSRAYSQVILDIFAKLNENKIYRKSFHNLFKNKIGDECVHAVGDFDVLDVEVVGVTIRSNSFAARYLNWEANSFNTYATGLWNLPSFVNHSCWVNSRNTYIGDLLILRASEDIPEGNQIFTTYIDNNLGYVERSKQLREKFGFTCTCRRCAIESQESPEVLTKRENLVAEMEELRIELGSGWEAKLESLITETEKTYTFRPNVHPRIQMADEIFKLALAYLFGGKPRAQTIMMFMKVMNSVGFVFDEEDRVLQYGTADTASLGASTRLSELWMEEMEIKRSRQWYETTMTLIMILTGYKRVKPDGHKVAGK